LVYRVARRLGKGWCTAWCTGLSARELAAIFDEAEQEKPLAAVLRSGPGRPKASEAKHSQRRIKHGDNEEYAEVRLRRDDPEMAGRVERA
jgi:hypothetical protein